MRSQENSKEFSVQKKLIKLFLAAEMSDPILEKRIVTKIFVKKFDLLRSKGF